MTDPVTNRLLFGYRSVKKLSEEKHEENWNFRSFLKGNDAELEEIDKIVHEFYETISAQIDCTKCVNCCRKVLPILNQKDIQRFSAGSGITEHQFKEEYLILLCHIKKMGIYCYIFLN